MWFKFVILKETQAKKKKEPIKHQQIVRAVYLLYFKVFDLTSIFNRLAFFVKTNTEDKTKKKKIAKKKHISMYNFTRL